jgi:hypothetical protein
MLSKIKWFCNFDSKSFINLKKVVKKDRYLNRKEECIVVVKENLDLSHYINV